MPRGISILFCTHIFEEKKNVDLTDEYIFGKKIANKIKYINKLIGVEK